MVTDETNATAKNEETVESSDLDVLVSLLGSERTTVAEEINEANGDTSVDVQDELDESRFMRIGIKKGAGTCVQYPSWQW